MHFHRDIRGESSSSWENLLKKEQIEMEICGEGLGRLPGLAQLVAQHILAAENTGEMF